MIVQRFCTTFASAATTTVQITSMSVLMIPMVIAMRLIPDNLYHNTIN